MLKALSSEVRYYRGWFDVYVEGLRNRDSPSSFQELFVWFFNSGQTLDERKPEMIVQSDAAQVNQHMADTGRIFIRWKLLKLELDRSRPFTRTYGLPLNPEPRVSLSRSGQALAKQAEVWRDVAILRYVLMTFAERRFSDARVPIAVANFLFLILKVSLNWTAMSAQIAGIVGAGFMLLASIARSDSHHTH